MVDPTQVAQFAVNGLIIGSILTLTAVGLTLVYGILDLANFAHGDLLTLGAYLALFLTALVSIEQTTSWALWTIAILLVAVAFDRFARPWLVEATGTEGRFAPHGMQRQEVAVGLVLAAVIAAMLAALRWPAGVSGWMAAFALLGALTMVAVARALPAAAADAESRLWLGLGAGGWLLAVVLLKLVFPALFGVDVSWATALAVGFVLVLAGALTAHRRVAGDPWVMGAFAVAVVLAAYLFGSPFLLGVVLAIVVVAVASMALDVLVWRPMRKQRAGVLTLIIISIGMALAIRNLIIVEWGPSIRNFPRPVTRAQPILGTSITIAESEFVVIVSAAIVILLMHLLLKYTKMGKAMRALSDNIDLARVTGIDVDRVILHMWAIAAGLAALAGVLLALIINIHPNMGWFLLLPIFAAVILGGIGSPYGAMAGGLTIGLAMEVSPAFGVPVAYKLAVGFAALILVLLVRPQGIAGGSA